MSEQAPKKKHVPVGEMVAVGGLVISALALWNSWGGDKPAPEPTKAEAPAAIPLVLRGKVEDGGKAIRLAPIEDSHALEEMTVTTASGAAASFGSEPVLSAAGVEDWIPENAKRDGTGAVAVTIASRYVEHGNTRTAKQRYRIDYRWTDGGLLGGKSLRLTGFRRG